ncbi:hypothetical protein DSM104443_01123 [Usitatibacter rugosus]|uniref:Uncharacterized protein n=1 Tax=Usitatibacter rugosus TaxID=2732067 RepID=A0A6M4GSI8_9PROT|nr:hypothetical protein [Usitatibacter rugosus]QJR10072.1 hypothetical protein DSM104443_01123 [Usitatibacter rugosus]
MADRSGALLLMRMITVVIALAVLASIVIAEGLAAFSKTHGFGMTDVLVAPFVFVFYAGPPLAVIGMASRSKSMVAGAIPLLLAAAFAGLLVIYRLVPWHFHRLGGSSDGEMQLLIVMVFALWPLAAGGGLLWLILNRLRADP